MAQTGKKINELTAITTVSDETVLPAVYVSGGNASSTANKVSIEQISNKITEDISTVLEGKQDKLTAGDNITIENNVISAEVPSLPENVYTEENLIAGDGITLTKEDDVTTITAIAQVPDNVWTQDNLVAGKDISITDKYTVNGTIVGNPTISSDCILSGITMNSYLIGPTNPSLPITSFEFGAKFTTSSSNPGRYQAIFGQTTQNKLTPQMALNGAFILQIPCTADGENWVTVESGYALSYNTTYWAKAIWDGSNWTAYLSTDGTSYSELGSLPLSAVYWVEPMAIGYDYNTSHGNVFNGSIDLKECYVKVNGEEYWRGATAIGKQINNTQDLSNYATQSDISGMLKNTATGAASLTIGSSYSTTTQGGINIGTLTRAAGANSIAIGASNSTSFYTQANQGNSLAIGYYNRNNASYAVSVGSNVQITSAGNNGVAVGYLTNVSANSATAIGYNATASAQSAIQLGSGTNSTANTFKVFDTPVVDANGKIPMTSTDITSLTGYDATKTQVLKNVNGTLTWVDEA